MGVEWNRAPRNRLRNMSIYVRAETLQISEKKMKKRDLIIYMKKHKARLNLCLTTWLKLGPN